MKRPHGASKGILVLTHKELPQVPDHVPEMRRVLDALRQHYVVAAHYGWFQDAYEPPAWVDFHFAPRTTVRFARPEAVRALPFNSSHFTPACFRPRPTEKQWDVIAVTRPVAFKNTDRLLRALRILKTRRPQSRALVICSSSTQSKRANLTGELLRQYETDFTFNERQDIVLLVSRTAVTPFAFPRRDLAWLYSASRTFALFSDQEGGAKAVKEAMLCGLPVVLNRQLRGGGLEFCNESNSRLFTTETEAAEAMLELLTRPEGLILDTTELARQASETHTIPRLLDALAALYAELGLPWDGAVDTEDLSMKLPSHSPELVPHDLKSGWTSDLRAPSAMLTFLAQLVQEAGGAPLGTVSTMRAGLHFKRLEGERRARRLLGQAKSLIRPKKP